MFLINGRDATATTETTGLVKSFTETDIKRDGASFQRCGMWSAPKPKNIEACSRTTISKDLDPVLRKAISISTPRGRENNAAQLSNKLAAV
jgi:hypothetical protein